MTRAAEPRWGGCLTVNAVFEIDELRPPNSSDRVRDRLYVHQSPVQCLGVWSSIPPLAVRPGGLVNPEGSNPSFGQRLGWLRQAFGRWQPTNSLVRSQFLLGLPLAAVSAEPKIDQQHPTRKAVQPKTQNGGQRNENHENQAAPIPAQGHDRGN